MTTVMDTRPLRHWLHTADGPHLLICCADHPDPGGWLRAVVRPGLPHAVVQLATMSADLTPAVLLELVAGGAAGVTVALDGCANLAGPEAVVARANAFLMALHCPVTIDAAKAVPQDRKRGGGWPVVASNAVPMSRRALLGRPDGLDLLEPSGHQAQRLVAVLRELAAAYDAGAELDGIPTGVPRLKASTCAGGGACARTCPVDALTLTRTVLAEASPERDAMSQFQLTSNPGRCTDCGKCLEVCPESALERSGEYLWSELLEGDYFSLRVGLTRRCVRCGGPHGRLGDLCAVCAFRAANPFGSSMPPGWPASSAADPR